MTETYIAANSALINDSKTTFKTCLEPAARCAAVALAFCVPLTNTGTTIFSIVFLILALMSMDRAKFETGFKHPIAIAACVYVAYYMLTAVYSVGSLPDILSAWRKVTRLLYIPLLIPLFTNSRWRLVALISFLCAMLTSVLMSWDLVVPFFKDNIFTSLFIAFASYITLNYIVVFKKFRIITVPLLFLFVYYQFFICIGRTGQVVFFALYFLFMYKNFGKALLWQAITTLGVAAIFAASLLNPSSFSNRQTEAAHEIKEFIVDQQSAIDTSSMGARLTFAKNSLKLIEARPLFGWGAGGFANAYKQQITPEAAKNVYPVNPHNQYLLTNVETGFWGVLAMLYMFFTMLRCFWVSRELDAKIGVGLITAIAMGCFVNSWLLDYASMFFVVTYSGILAGCLVAKKDKACC
jgi:O-antigen ligase